MSTPPAGLEPPAPQPRVPRPRLWEDVVPALLAVLVFVPITAGVPEVSVLGGASIPQALVSLVALAASVGMPLAMIWRASHPAAAAATVYGLALAHFLLGIEILPADTMIFAALYSVTVRGARWARYAGLAGALFGSFMLSLSVTVRTGSITADTLLAAGFVFALLASFVLATWALALVRRSRVDRVESLRERAARLEWERDQQALLATQAERNRIAREMHDIVAHSLSVVIAQADGGRYAAAADPAAATRALTTISETGRAALADMRRILGVLRDEHGRPEDLIPQPDDADLAHLVATVRESGLEVSFVEMGAARALPPGIGTTVYRITQEALTNVLKHGGPNVQVTVLQQWAAQHLILQIDDNGRGAATAVSSDGLGQGLLGMRERATMLGGTLTAGPRPGGGFRIRAEIPIPAGAARPSAPVAAPVPGTLTCPAPSSHPALPGQNVPWVPTGPPPTRKDPT